MIIFIVCLSTRENYGGPVSNNMYLRPRECMNICKEYEKVCMNAYGGLDAGACQDYFGNACINSCLYNRYHRI